MSFKLNNRFKSISGFVLALGLLFATPILASQQDTVASDSAKAATTAVAAPAATDSVAKDTTAAAGTAAVASASSSTEASAAAPAVEEVKQIDPQVYKNFTYYVLLFLVICTVVAVIGKVLSIYELIRKMNVNTIRLRITRFNRHCYSFSWLYSFTEYIGHMYTGEPLIGDLQ